MRRQLQAMIIANPEAHRQALVDFQQETEHRRMLERQQSERKTMLAKAEGFATRIGGLTPVGITLCIVAGFVAVGVWGNLATAAALSVTAITVAWLVTRLIHKLESWDGVMLDKKGKQSDPFRDAPPDALPPARGDDD